MIFLRVCLVFLVGLAVIACVEEESVCETDGPCETLILLQCECCQVDTIADCKVDKSAACASGNLTIGQSAESCAETTATWDQYQSRGEDPCLEMPQDQYDQVCTPLMSE
jgi:hypothetical protein